MLRIEKHQKSNQRKSLKLCRVGSISSIICATELGLLQESTLKDVTIVNYSDLVFLFTKNVERSPDLETIDCAAIASKSVNIFGGSWPFINPVQARRIISTKIRKRGKKRRWSIRRQKKPRDTVARCRDENLGVSNDRSTRLSRDNFSLTQPHTRSRDRDKDENRERLSGSYGSADEEDEEVRQATSETSLEEITRTDYPSSGFCSTSSRQKEAPQNRAELSEYPDYFMNVLLTKRMDNSTENDDIDVTSEDVTSSCDTSRDDTRSAKLARAAERVLRRINARTSIKSEKASDRTRKRSSRERSSHLSNNGDRFETKRRRNRSVVKEERRSSSVTNNRRNSPRISCYLEKNPPKERSRGEIAIDTARTVRKRCPDCNARQSSTNAVCACKRNLKNTASTIMRDIQAHIRDAEIATNVEDIRDTISEIPAVSPAEEPSDKDLDKDLIDIYGSVDSEFNNEDVLSQESKQSLDSANADPQESFMNFNTKRKRGKRRLNRHSIDCKFVDRTETAYQSVFHECVDFDSSTATSSLKINMDESWRSDDRDSGVEMIQSWRRSTLTGERDNEDDSAVLLARKIINDDSAKDEKSYDEILNECYKYHETPDILSTGGNDSNEDTEDTKFANEKDIITYRRNKNRITKRTSSVDRSFVKDDKEDVKVQDGGMRSARSDEKVNVMRRGPDSKNNDAEYESDEKEYAPRRVTRALVKTNKENHVGKLVWGYCSGWWPALIVDAADVGMAAVTGKLWVYWIGESQISLLKEKTQIQPFSKNLEHRLTSKPSHKSVHSRAINATIQMLRQRFGCSTLTKPYYYWIRRNIAAMEKLDDITFYPYPNNIQDKLNVLKEKNAKVTQKYILSQNSSSPETTPIKKQSAEKCKEASTSWKQIEDERLPLQNQYPGVIAWAKIAGHCWWPAMIIDYRDCCLKEPSFGCQWIMWYGDYKVSEVRHLEFLKFHKGFEKMRDYIRNTVKQSYIEGVIQAAKDYCSRLGCNTDNWTLDNVFEYFSNMNNIHVPYNQLQVSDSNKIYDKYSDEIIKKINDFKSKPDVDVERKRDIKASDALRRVVSGECAVEKLCLKCLKFSKGRMEEHPFFIGALCRECSDAFKPCMFVHGNDGKCFYCTICAATGTVLICDVEDCPRVYCTACLKFLLCPKSYDDMLLEDPWECFLCRDESRQPEYAILHPRLDWKEKLTSMFRTASNFPSYNANPVSYRKQKRPIHVLSLFDGLSTGFLVLQKLGISVEVYYASEIDTNALTISSAHFGDRITYLGDVRGITKEKIQEIAPIDLLIGGSPCNDLSLVNPARLGLHDPKGTGILFFEYCRIKKLLSKINKDRHLFWLYENVASMPSEYRLEINKHLGQEPDVIDAADFSPQHRLRLYWHNFPFNPYMPLFQSEQDVQDKLTPNLNRKALCKKLRTVTCRTGSLLQGKAELKPIMMEGRSDTLWITELEEIFGFPRHYTDVKNLSATNRQKLLGKSWSVQTLTAILRPLCFYFKCNEDETSKSASQGDNSCRGKHF